MNHFEELYKSGKYLEKNPSWHVEESPWKARQIVQMMVRNRLSPRTICEVGCGVGEVLKQLQEHMSNDCVFYGYEISPQAFELCTRRANERLHFKLADIGQEKDAFFDLILVLDVLEHLENYFSFLRTIKPKGSYAIFHIPLDLSVQTVLRRHALLKRRELYAHIHYFTKETALQTLKDVGYEVLDCFYTPRSIDMGSAVTQRLLRLPRKLFFTLHQDWAVHLLGGFSLLVLAQSPSPTLPAMRHRPGRL